VESILVSVDQRTHSLCEELGREIQKVKTLAEITERQLKNVFGRS
jgi:hypothetical protein